MKRLILISLFLSSMVWARGYSPEIENSLRSIHPRMRASWLKVRGIEDPYYSKPFIPDSQNVRLVGKWGRGPSLEVTGKDSLVFASLGSEVAVVKVSNTGVPQILYEIQARSFVYNSIIKDSLLFIGAEGEVEIWNVANPQNPIARNHISLVLNDIFVQDTFLYTISEDSFKIFNVANITNPYLTGACRDSGNMLFVSGNYAYLGDRWGLYVLNVSNPQNPTRVSVLSGGAEIGAIWVEGNHCYYTTGSGLEIANVQDPAHPWAEGNLPSIGGSDIYKLSYFLYLPGFDIIDVGDSSNPTQISHLDLPGWEEGVWANNPFGYAFVADYREGLQIINISNPTNPCIDTMILDADYALDVVVDSHYAYVTDNDAGLKIIEVINPNFPFQIGEFDSIGSWVESATVKDSLAFIGIWDLWVLNVRDPAHPTIIGRTQMFNYAKDMLVRDTLIYIAEDYKFEIFNISNPRQPRLMGSCSTPGYFLGFDLKDTFGYVAGTVINIINVANPSNPRVINTLNEPATKVAVTDTFAYILAGNDSLSVWNFANPYNPYQISSICLQRGGTWDVIVESTLAYIGSTFGITIVDVTNPLNLRIKGFYDTPDYVRRVSYSSPYIYCACFGSGMCILEKLPVGIEENNRPINAKNIMLNICPNPTGSYLTIRLPQTADRQMIKIFNVSGKLIKEIATAPPRNDGIRETQIYLKGINHGIYFFQVGKEVKKFLVVK